MESQRVGNDWVTFTSLHHLNTHPPVLASHLHAAAPSNSTLGEWERMLVKILPRQEAPILRKSKHRRMYGHPENAAWSRTFLPDSLWKKRERSLIEDQGLVSAPRIREGCACDHFSVVSDSSPLHGLWPASFLCPRDFSGKNTGWVAFPFSRGSSQPRDLTRVSRTASRFFTVWATKEAHIRCITLHNQLYFSPSGFPSVVQKPARTTSQDSCTTFIRNGHKHTVYILK